MRVTTLLLLLASATPWAAADVQFTALPASIAGGTAFTVSWADSGVAPPLSELTAWTLFVYTGPNSAPQQLVELSSGAFTAGSSVSATVPASVGGMLTDAYFLGMVSAAMGGTVINFSNRFSMTGMTGSFTSAQMAALGTPGSSGPATINNIVESGPAGFDVPFNLQEGPTRYAPMQPVPPKAITATNTSPQWPTSSVVLATVPLPVPTIATTLTQAQTFVVASHENTASPALMPSDDMFKFLNRWKD